MGVASRFQGSGLGAVPRSFLMVEENVDLEGLTEALKREA